MRRYFSLALFMVVALVISACGGGGGGGGGTPSSNFPYVAGTYAVVEQSAPLSCSDGSTGTLNGKSGDITISQNGNILNAGAVTQSDLPAGITLISSTPATGDIGTDGAAVLTDSYEVTVVNVSGFVTYNRTENWTFTSTGFSGTTVSSDYSLIGSCTATIPVTGTRL